MTPQSAPRRPRCRPRSTPPHRRRSSPCGTALRRILIASVPGS
jgi:hypothetical protein